MEDITAKLDRIETDVDKIVDLYDYAEKVFPYDKIRDTRKVTNNFLEALK